MKLKIKDNEFDIKFGFEATLKSRIISRIVKLEDMESKDNVGEVENLEELLLTLPELLLVGLQKNHEEYRYDYDTEGGKGEQLEKTFSLIEDYLDYENGDAIELFKDMENEMLKNGFLKKLFQEEQKKTEKEKKERNKES